MKMRALTLAFLVLGLAGAVNAAAPVGERYVVLPFSNETGEESLRWMGEGLAIGITDHLLAAGATAVDAERRRSALVEMGLDGTQPVTLASAVLLGRRLGAGIIVVGEYGLLDGHRLAISGKAIASGERATEQAVDVRGDMGDLHSLQREFATKVLPRKVSHSAADSAQHLRQLSRVPLSSFEFYARAMAAAEHERRRDLLTRALEADPLYPAALIARARLEIDEGRPQSAFLWLDRLKVKDLAFPERYWLVRGDASAGAGDKGSAIDHYRKALAIRPMAPAYFRLAAVQAQQGRLVDARANVSTGLALDPMDPEGLELREALAHAPDAEHAS